MGQSASLVMTNVAIASPNMAGKVPSTGSMRTRKPFTGAYSSASSSCSSGNGKSVTGPGFSELYTTGTPESMPERRKRRRTVRARGSSNVLQMSAIWIREGSLLAPAPIEDMIGSE